jgi:trk system potassium uptake protein TrkA
MLGGKERRMVVVIGSSRLGAAIASKNSKDGYYTAIIDKDKNAFKKLDDTYSGFTWCGDATEKMSLEKAHVAEATEVDVVTDDDDTNIFVASVILKHYKAPLVIVRLQDERKSVLLNDPRISFIVPSALSFETYDYIVKESRK